jgi:hypothetical protein
VGFFQKMIKNYLMANIKVLTLIALFPLLATALNKQTQYWGSLSLIKPLDEKWVTSLELINRYSVDNGESFVKSTRIGLGYNFENDITYTAILEDRRTDRHDNNEKRLIHQFSKKWGLEAVSLSLRFRQEHRKFNDSEVWMNRSILRAAIDFENLKFKIFTPFVSSEHKYVLNSVEGRKAGSIEARNSIGLDMQLTEDLNADLSYMDRRTFVPRDTSSRNLETFFQVAVLSLSYRF